MDKWKKIKLIICLSSLVPISLLCLTASNVYLIVIAISLFTVVGLSLVYVERQAMLHEVNVRVQKELTQAQQKYLTQLSHHRHDAMNDIQVLLGYIRLDNKDRFFDYVDKIKRKAQEHSALAKLNDYELVSFIDDLNKAELTVNVELQGSTTDFNWNKQCSLFMIAVISCYQKYAVQNEHGEQQLTIYIGLDKHLHMQFEYNGDILTYSAWKAEIETIVSQTAREKRLILNIDEQDINSTFLD